VFIGGDDFKSGQTKVKSVLVDFLISAGIKALPNPETRNPPTTQDSWAEWPTTGIADFRDSESSYVNIHVGPYGRKFLGTSGG
jgi:hypothetical protein